jgi:hypothetical protein
LRNEAVMSGVAVVLPNSVRVIEVMLPAASWIWTRPWSEIAN